MPQKGFKAITVSEDVWDRLKIQAEKDGLSLPQLISQYMVRADSVNALSWIDNPQEVQSRIDQRANEIYGRLIDSRNKAWAKQFRLKGEVPPAEMPYEERVQMENECRELAYEIARAITEKDKETYEDLKKLEEEKNIKYHLGSRPTLTDHRGNVISVGEKTHAEQYHEKLLSISNRLEAIFSQEDALRKNIVEIGDLANQGKNLRKYVPYLSDEDKALDEKITKMLGV